MYDIFLNPNKLQRIISPINIQNKKWDKSYEYLVIFHKHQITFETILEIKG